MKPAGDHRRGAHACEITRGTTSPGSVDEIRGAGLGSGTRVGGTNAAALRTPGAEQYAHVVRTQVGDRDVRTPIAVEIADRDRQGRIANWVCHRRLQCTVAVAEQLTDGVDPRRSIRNDNVLLPIAVEIVHCH
jgi:hypothetical protein